MVYKKEIKKRDLIWLILGISFFIRLIGINQSMWLDEAVSANVAKMGFSQIISDFSIKDFHPPLFYLFLNLWGKIFGTSVISLRFTSILFSLIAIYFVYLIAKKLKDERSALWAAIFLSINPLFVYYSQELRMYSMATMWLIVAFYFFVKIKDKKYKKSDLIFFNLTSALAFGTFYGSVFFIASMAIYFLIKREYKIFWQTNLGMVVAVLILSPLLIEQLKNSTIMLSQVKNWSLILGKVTFKNILLIPLKFNIGRISFYPKFLYYLVGFGWSLVVLFFVFFKKTKNSWLKVFLLLPIFLAILFSIKTPLLDYFRFLYLIPIMALLLAINIERKWQKILIGGGFLIFSLVYLLNTNFYREDWKKMVDYLGNIQRIYMIGSFGDPIKYYNPEIEIRDIKIVDPKEKEAWLIPYGAEIHGMNLEDKMTKLGYRETLQVDFRGLVVERWKK